MHPPAFVFDLGNVVVRFDPERARLPISARSRRIDVEPEYVDLKIRYERGQLGSAEFAQAAVDLLEFEGTPAEFLGYWDGIFLRNPPMEQLVGQLDAPLYLLSNTSDSHLTRIRRDFPILQRFMGGVYSFEVGLLKPDPQIFHLTLERFNLIGQPVVYIDDLAPNVAAAAACGFEAYQYDFRRHDEFVTSMPWLGSQGTEPTEKFNEGETKKTEILLLD
ncbi:MAG: HAD-IA family hydrolase [Verrucomicrobia bacterium]|nr:HAD-IA family hydrolase [Verrucomicrobiota bacterium]